MKLLVDIGNSRIKWAVLTADSINSQPCIVKKTAIKASLKRAWHSLDNISAVYVSNVAGNKIAQQLTEWTEKQWQITPIFISSEASRFGVHNAYPQPELLGTDRWLALIAAKQQLQQTSCIIDCGTAITIDVLTESGIHQGGMIIPGLTLMREALHTGTSNISDSVAEHDFSALAVTTQTAVYSGTLYTIIATLERLIDDLTIQFNHKIDFIITGGDAEIILATLTTTIKHDPDLVLTGLAHYADQQEKSY